MSSVYALPMPSYRSSGAPPGRGLGYRVADLPTPNLAAKSLSVLDAGIRWAVKKAMETLAQDVFVPLFTARTAEEFNQWRDEAYEIYCEKLAGVNTILSVLSTAALADVHSSARVLKAVETGRLNALPWKFENGPEEVLFCISTLLRATELVQMGVAHVPLLDQAKLAEDRDLAAQYGQNAMWAQMHMGALLYGLAADLEATPDSLDGLLLGMRASLHAYSAASLAVNLRVPAPEVDWSAEEQFELDLR